MRNHKKRPLNSKHVAPDELFSSRVLQLARFGSKVLLSSNRSESDYATLMARLAKRYPEVVKEVDRLVEKIFSAVAVLPPSQLMQRAWYEFFISSRNISVESDVKEENATALRMIDYVQSVIAATPRGDPQKTELSDADWAALRNDVATLYRKLNVEYPASYTAHVKAAAEGYSEEMQELLVRAQLQWCNVRGDYYQVHQVGVLSDLLRPQSDLIEAAYGITAETLVGEFNKIWRSLTFGLHDVMIAFNAAYIETMDEVQRMISKDHEAIGSSSFPELLDIAVRTLGHKKTLDAAMQTMHGMALFDVGKITSLPRSFLDDFSWAPAQDTDFLAAGEMRGWPLRIQPIFRRPFLKLDGTYYCFDLHSLFDNFYRQMEKRIFQRSEQEKQTWISNRKEISETLPVEYFSRLLPGATILRELYYPLPAEPGAAKKWCEADCVISYDDHIFIIEVKAGAFTYTSPANDLPAYVKSLQALVGAPGKQGQRFLRYLKSADEVEIYDARHKPVGKLRRGDYRSKTICAVTLDPFTDLAARAQHLNKFGVDVGDLPIWPLSLSDLCVYADVFVGPLDFLHYTEQRMRAAESQTLDLDDELDHLGLYLEHNNYAMHADELAGGGENLQFHGYRSAVDAYYASKLTENQEPTPPTQALPIRVRQIVDFLATRDQPHRSQIACYLLDLDGMWRAELSSFIDKELVEIQERGLCFPGSTHGNVRLTVFVNIAGVVEISHEKATEYAQKFMVMQGEPDRQLLELTYGPEGVKKVNMTMCRLQGLSEEYHAHLVASAAELKERRLVRSVAEFGKIGRNHQ